MSTETGNSVKEAAKDWAKDYFIITPWNIVSFFSIFSLIKVLCGIAGQSSFGSAIGNLELAGIFFLAAIMSATSILLGRALLKVKVSEQTEKFWWTGILIPIGIAGSFTFLGRAILILIGLMKPGTITPAFLRWFFEPNTLEWLKNLGNP